MLAFSALPTSSAPWSLLTSMAEIKQNLSLTLLDLFRLLEATQRPERWHPAKAK